MDFVGVGEKGNYPKDSERNFLWFLSVDKPLHFCVAYSTRIFYLRVQKENKPIISRRMFINLSIDLR